MAPRTKVTVAFCSARPRDEAGRRKPRLDDERRAVQQRLEETVQRVGVEHRQRRHQHVALADAEKLAGIERPPEILGVRTAHALRQAGGAGRVEDRERIARLDRVRRKAVRRAAETARHFRCGKSGPCPSPTSHSASSAIRVARQGRQHRRQSALDDHKRARRNCRGCARAAPRARRC